MALNTADVNAIADRFWSKDFGGVEAEDLLRVLLSAATGKVSGADTNTIKFRDTDDTRDRIVATVDEHGNRSEVTLDVSP